MFLAVLFLLSSFLVVDFDGSFLPVVETGCLVEALRMV